MFSEKNILVNGFFYIFVEILKLVSMKKVWILCLLSVFLWSCSSSDEDFQVVDHKISLDTPTWEYTGYVYKYNDLDYDYLLSLGFDERCEYATVPEDTLKRMTTEALAQSCMFWPVCGNHAFYPTYSLSIYDGIVISFEHCNALQELAKREQGAIALLKLYKYFKLGDFYNYKHNWYETDIRKLNDNIMHKQHLEMLLSTEYFTPKLSKEHLVLLAEETERNLLDLVEKYEGPVSWMLGAGMSYLLWQRILLCYDKYVPILTDEEKNIFKHNIKSFGLLGIDKTDEYTTLIAEKVKLMCDTESN